MSIGRGRFRGPWIAASHRLLALALMTSLAGCMTWRSQLADPRAVVERGPEAVRVSGGLGAVTVVGPYLAGDTIVGRLDRRSGVETRVPLDQVQMIETRHLDAKPLAYAIIATVSVLLVSYLALLYSMQNAT